MNINDQFLNPGDMFFATRPTKMTTVLGSCAGFFIYDPVLKIGGGSHYVIPNKDSDSVQIEERYRYGEFALFDLIRRFKREGSKRADLKVYLFGCASTQSGDLSYIGSANLEYAKAFCRNYGLKIAHEITGGNRGYNITFFSHNGQFECREIRTDETISNVKSPGKLICIGASTGGTSVVPRILKNVGQDFPPILYVQHMPAAYLPQYAQRLALETGKKVVMPNGYHPIEKNTIYISPGAKHMVVSPLGGVLKVHLEEGPPVNSFCPSVDKLFFSTIHIPSKILAILCTGMGDDGARGLLELKKNRHLTIIQSKETCDVWGMPRRAAELGAATMACDPDGITESINLFQRNLRKSA